MAYLMICVERVPFSLLLHVTTPCLCDVVPSAIPFCQPLHCGPMYHCAVGQCAFVLLAIEPTYHHCQPSCLRSYHHASDSDLRDIVPSAIVPYHTTYHCAIGHRAFLLYYHRAFGLVPLCHGTIVPSCLCAIVPLAIVPWYHRTIVPHGTIMPFPWYHLASVPLLSYHGVLSSLPLSLHHTIVCTNVLALYYHTISVPLCVGHHAAIIRTYHRASVPSAIDSQLSHLPPHSSLLQTPIFGWLLCIKVIIGISF